MILAVILQVLYGDKQFNLILKGDRDIKEAAHSGYCKKKPYKISEAGVISKFEFPHRIPTVVESSERPLKAENTVFESPVFIFC